MDLSPSPCVITTVCRLSSPSCAVTDARLLDVDALVHRCMLWNSCSPREQLCLDRRCGGDCPAMRWDSDAIPNRQPGIGAVTLSARTCNADQIDLSCALVRCGRTMPGDRPDRVCA